MNSSAFDKIVKLLMIGEDSVGLIISLRAGVNKCYLGAKRRFPALHPSQMKRIILALENKSTNKGITYYTKVDPFTIIIESVRL